MELKNHSLTPKTGILPRILQLINLRPEESDRTWLMFAFYTTTCIGLRWSEDTTVALFLDKYNADSLPWIYIASAVTGAVLVFCYSWLQKIFSLRWVVIGTVPCMFAVLFLLRQGLEVSYAAVITIFLLRLWVDASYVLNDLNTSIAANQLFNIQEIKRAYPLVSSGILVADILGGFSLPLLLIFVGLDGVIFPFASILIVVGAVILFYLTHNYRYAFPSVPNRLVSKVQSSSGRRLSTPLRHYALLLFAFFGLLQVIGIFIDFQYLAQLKSNYNEKDIASFLGLFGGVAGICELLVQLFLSSRILQRFGVFVTIALLPITVAIFAFSLVILLSLTSATPQLPIFWGMVFLKFLDELLRYTFVLSSGPLLFQPIPDKVRTKIQALASGVAEAFGAGAAGALILITLWLVTQAIPQSKTVILIETIIIALICLVVIWVLRSHYVSLLVFSAGKKQLKGTDIDLRSFKQAVIKALKENTASGDRSSCIELLSELDPQGAEAVLAPLLIDLPPDLQQLSLEKMLQRGANPTYLTQVGQLLNEETINNITPEVSALAIRYVYLAESHPDLRKLEEYLHGKQHSIVRATAAALLLRQGTPIQQLAATRTLRWMLTHKQERERTNAVKALREAVYLQVLRIYIPSLLQDKSLRVRCAVLEMIAANRLEEYYGTLISGLHYKSTRNTAMTALVQLENEVLEPLFQLATNLSKPQTVRMFAWRTIGQISTLEASDTIWQYLGKSKGTTRDNILRTLLKIHQQSGNTILVDKFQEIKIKTFIHEELQFLGEIYATYIDLKIQGKVYANYVDFKSQPLFYNNQLSDKIIARGELLQRAILNLEIDVKERILRLLKLLYPIDKIQAATINIRSQSLANLARGLEILDHTVTLRSKPILLNILDRYPPEEKLQNLVENGIIEYQQMIIRERIHKLLLMEEFLSDWCLACCFHFAEVARISLEISHILRGLKHSTGFVREASIAYLSIVSPRVLVSILPQVKNDPHPLVVGHIDNFISKNGVNEK
ncbi:MFS transporter [Mastigocoleus testarum]|uniref:MFS transporter n=1 Tax=Mastigocoleus testarum BC008 TaxID=371196 RepID=A0A0V7ZZ50_9CYAN|nr:MFS transporter [Mastigocoleus testarum]KST67618.1 hypothetical protein BC008_30965 [Mastigocoleus testarum BC008]KST69746.1 hypothetical protein BC008_35885 [Mastigocoleus testarum BC008]